MSHKIELNKARDKIFFCAPASGGAHLLPQLNFLAAKLKTQGFNCVIPDDLFYSDDDARYGVIRHEYPKEWLELKGRTSVDNAKEDRAIWNSNSVAIRTKHLQWALKQPDIKLILTLKGGYGSAEVAHNLSQCPDLEVISDKAIIGYSDCTILLNYLNQQHQVRAIHGPMVTELVNVSSASLTKAPNYELTEHFLRLNELLQGGKTIIDLQPYNNTADNLAEELVGEICGGNLTCICSTIGTPVQMNTKDKILLLEDVNEKGYQITRSLLQLKESGLLNAAKAIIFGVFTDGDAYSELAPIRAIYQMLEPTIPCFRTTQIGHIKAANRYIPLDKAKIYQQKLTVESPF